MAPVYLNSVNHTLLYAETWIDAQICSLCKLIKDREESSRVSTEVNITSIYFSDKSVNQIKYYS